MRELALIGLVAILFGLGSYYATEHFGAFSRANLTLGSLALLTAMVARARRLRWVGGPHSRPVILRGLLLIAAALALAVGIERAADFSRVEFDWTGERRFELSPATRKALAELPGPISATLYHDAYDPRTRRTRLLLEKLAQLGPVEVRERLRDDAPEEVDRYEIGTSNSVVLELGDRFATVERPTEGTLYEALYRLRSLQSGVITLLRGEGQGDPRDEGELGYSGLAAALDTEGYQLRSVASAAMTEVSEDTDAVLLISPRRRLREVSIEALRRYLERGGRLLALLEPGVESGVEDLLAEYGIETPNSVLIDPTSGAIQSEAEGIGIVAYNYATHPATQGLNSNRMTFFPGVRPIAARRPRPEDRVEGVVWSSPHAWTSGDLSLLQRRSGRIQHDGSPRRYHFIAVAGRYPRDGKETRIVAFGDSGFASNRYLRALYDLDLILNSVHWAAQQEANITLRPKIRDVVQFPMPVESTLRTLYGVGLLVPELLLIAGGIVWLRRRSA
jgi:hypothetical protein